MKCRPPRSVSALVMTSLLGLTLACSKVQPGTASGAANADPQITNAIQGKLYADPAIQSKQISVEAENGVVTLGGSVGTEAERTQAAAAAATVAGVRTVVNNITVGNPEVPPTQAAAPVPDAAPMAKPHASKPARRNTYRDNNSYDNGNNDSRNNDNRNNDNRNNDNNDYANNGQSAPGASDTAASTPVAAPAPVTPPPPPPPAKVTVDSGTSLAVRLVDTIDSETAQQGQSFRATLDAPLAVGGEVVIPAGYDVQGHVVEVQSAGKFEGRSLLALQLDRIQVGSKHYAISTSQYRRDGSSRSKNTAEKVGAGAVIGAIIGGIAGGGRGAGIGAAAGGGLGGGVQATGKGQQIKLPSETVLTFSLQAPLTVTPTSEGPNATRPKLDAAPPSPSDPNPPNSNPQK